MEERTKYLCTKDCQKGSVFITYYFREGNVYDIRAWSRSKFYYIEYSRHQDVIVEKDFVENNFKLADTSSLLLAEVDNLFDSIFFE
jgi:hypothetical protein